MAIHNEPGRGRKQCTSCQKYVGVRSHSCENCGHSFGSSEVRGVSSFRLSTNRSEPVVPAIHKIVPTRKVLTESTTVPATVPANDDAKGSRVERINRLRDELIKELKISSQGYSASVINEIRDRVLVKWD